MLPPLCKRLMAVLPKVSMMWVLIYSSVSDFTYWWHHCNHCYQSSCNYVPHSNFVYRLSFTLWYSRVMKGSACTPRAAVTFRSLLFCLVSIQRILRRDCCLYINPCRVLQGGDQGVFTSVHWGLFSKPLTLSSTSRISSSIRNLEETQAVQADCTKLFNNRSNISTNNIGYWSKTIKNQWDAKLLF